MVIIKTKHKPWNHKGEMPDFILLNHEFKQHNEIKTAFAKTEEYQDHNFF